MAATNFVVASSLEQDWGAVVAENSFVRSGPGESNKALFELGNASPIGMAWKPDGSQLAVVVSEELPESTQHSLRIYETGQWQVVNEIEIPYEHPRFNSEIEFSESSDAEILELGRSGSSSRTRFKTAMIPALRSDSRLSGVLPASNSYRMTPSE